MKKHLGILWIVFALAAGGCDTMKFNPFTPTASPSPGSTTSEALSPPGAPTLITPPEGAVLDNGRTDYRDINGYSLWTWYTKNHKCTIR